MPRDIIRVGLAGFEPERREHFDLSTITYRRTLSGSQQQPEQAMKQD